jgi:thiamine pyrophosphate-dependent acetolactate synthase large subunit-like protein
MMNRFECLKLLASDLVDDETLVVTSLSTNTSVFSSIREGGAGFYGLNMGLCTPFALGVSLAFPNRKVLALDSDGSLMIDTSALITVADADAKNLVIVVFDNQAYARMGPTFTARRTDLEKMAQGAGISATTTVHTMDEFSGAVARALNTDGPTFIVAKVETETVRARATRPRRTFGHAMRETFVEQVMALPDHYSARAGK